MHAQQQDILRLHVHRVLVEIQPILVLLIESLEVVPILQEVSVLFVDYQTVCILNKGVSVVRKKVCTPSVQGLLQEHNVDVVVEDVVLDTFKLPLLVQVASLVPFFQLCNILPHAILRKVTHIHLPEHRL